MSEPLVSIIMGSQSDLETMQAATTVLTELGVPFETRVVSAHRTPARLVEFAEGAASRGLKVIICLLYTSPSPRDRTRSRMPSSA